MPYLDEAMHLKSDDIPMSTGRDAMLIANMQDLQELLAHVESLARQFEAYQNSQHRAMDALAQTVLSQAELLDKTENVHRSMHAALIKIPWRPICISMSIGVVLGATITVIIFRLIA